MHDKTTVMIAPAEVVEGLDDHYKDMMEESQQAIMKNGLLNVLETRMKRCEATESWLYDAPHPSRKRWIGFIPLHMEAYLQEQESIMFLQRQLAKPEVRIGETIRKLIEGSSSFKELAIANNQTDCGTNLGNLDSVFFPHVFWAKGSRMFKMDDDLVAMLDKTELGIQSPSGFVQPPYSNIFIEAHPDFTLFNRVSGDHEFDGVYINQFTIDAAQIDKDWDDRHNEEYKNSLSTYLADKGLHTRHGGDARVIEFMACGRPKDNIVDDATFNFLLIMQDPTISIKDYVDAHVEYYTTKVMGYTDGIETINASPRDVQMLTDIIEFVVKALLYINSDDVMREKVMELSDLQMAARRTQNKAKIRKLNRKIAYANDYIRIGLSDATKAKLAEGGGNKKTAHWRRGHFRHQRYGKDNALHKMIWIQPTIIGSTKPVSKNYQIK